MKKLVVSERLVNQRADIEKKTFTEIMNIWAHGCKINILSERKLNVLVISYRLVQQK